MKDNTWIKNICERGGISTKVREEVCLLANEIYTLQDRVESLEQENTPTTPVEPEPQHEPPSEPSSPPVDPEEPPQPEPEPENNESESEEEKVAPRTLRRKSKK